MECCITANQCSDQAPRRCPWCMYHQETTLILIPISFDFVHFKLGGASVCTREFTIGRPLLYSNTVIVRAVEAVRFKLLGGRHQVLYYV